jgi:hypothetical protein
MAIRANLQYSIGCGSLDRIDSDDCQLEATMKRRHDETRDVLVRSALLRDTVMMIAILLILAFAKALALPAKTENILLSLVVVDRIFTTLSSRFYFPRR